MRQSSRLYSLLKTHEHRFNIMFWKRKHSEPLRKCPALALKIFRPTPCPQVSEEAWDKWAKSSATKAFLSELMDRREGYHQQLEACDPGKTEILRGRAAGVSDAVLIALSKEKEDA